MIRKLLQKLAHQFVDSCSIRNCFSYGRPRLRAALRPLYARPKTFIIGIEVIKVILRVNFVAGLIGLKESFKKPRGMTHVPARRTHVISRLYNIILYFQRLDDFYRPRANTAEELR